MGKGRISGLKSVFLFDQSSSKNKGTYELDSEMIKRSFGFFVFFALLLASARPCLADSPQEMLAAGRIDDAIRVLNTRIASTPADAESANLLCRAYYALENWDRAESQCKKAVALDPNNGAYHFWLGHVYGEKADRASILSAAGLAGKTREELERAVQLNPQDVDARVDLAEFYFEAPSVLGGSQDKARAQGKIIGLTDPAREHWVYARIAEKNRDAATAEQEYRRMIEASHGDSEGWLNLAIFFRHQHRYDDVEQALVKTSQAPVTKPDVLVDIAQVLNRIGRNPVLAIQVLHRYLAARPVEKAPAFKAHYLLGTFFEKQGDKAAAAREYQASLSLAHQFGLAQQALNRVAH